MLIFPRFNQLLKCLIERTDQTRDLNELCAFINENLE